MIRKSRQTSVQFIANILLTFRLLGNYGPMRIILPGPIKLSI